jgi:multidrug efflux pump subunit AcrB
LYRYAEEMVQYLHERGRVVDLVIEVPNRREEENEYYMVYDHERLTRDSLRVQDIHAALSNLLFSSNLGKLKAQGLRSEIVLKPNSTDQPDLWQLENSFIQVGGREVRVSDYMNIQLRKAKNYISRKNQEYVLDVAFNVLGSWKYTEKIMKDAQETFNARFPVGFRCSTPSYQWDQTESQSYWLLGLVIIIIFMIGAILFESLYQALIIILLIPFSMIGTFMTYYVSGVEFGSGGFAAMILLCGLTVNAGIYLINEYNRIRGKKKCRNNKKIFLQTWNHKIIPILLTVLSTVCGLIPFLLDGPEDRFWFSLAVGSISGLTFSLLILVLLIPLLLRDKKRYD